MALPSNDQAQRIAPTAGLNRIVVVGSTGSGKTTLARALSGALGIPHIELDALHWGPRWTPVADEAFRERVRDAVAAERWVCDGNYSVVRDLLWQRADTLLWLDYPLWLIYWRLVPRTLRRGLRRELLWGNNRERLWEQIFSRDSLFLWVLQTYWRRRREFPILLQQPAYAHLRVVRLRSPRQTESWLRRHLPSASLAPYERCATG
jgi:adenylate kinase family enzyme